MGLLDQQPEAGQQASGQPMQQPMPAGQPPMQEGQQGGESIEVSQSARPVLRRAVEILYRDNFENMVQMIQSSYPEGLSSAISTTINTTLKKLKKEQQIPPDVIAEVGVALFAMVLEDMVMGGTLPQLDGAQFADALARTMRDYSDANPGEIDPAEMDQALMQAQQGG